MSARQAIAHFGPQVDVELVARRRRRQIDEEKGELDQLGTNTLM
jgi:hypothetical protein